MPINFLDKRQRMQRLGRVRLGIKVPLLTQAGKPRMKNGKSLYRPQATPHFVLTDATDLIQFCGEQPTTMEVHFLFNDLEMTFPHYLRRYTASALQCLGDGEIIHYGLTSGKVTARDGFAVNAETGKIIWENSMAQRAECAGEECPHYIGGACKPTGYLRFLPTEAPRLGYYDMVCHQRAIVGIRSQLELALALVGRLTDVPFLLHRGDEEKLQVPVKGEMKMMPVRTQWIEIEPVWLARFVHERRRQLAVPVAPQIPSTVEKDIADLFGDEGNGNAAVDVATGEVIAPEDLADFAEPDHEGEEIVSPLEMHGEYKAAGKLAPEPRTIKPWSLPNAERPASPEGIRTLLRHNAGWNKGIEADYSDAIRLADGEARPPDVQLCQRVAALMGQIFGNRDERLAVVGHLFRPVASTSDLEAREVSALAAYLESSGEEWEPNDMAAAECCAIWDMLEEAPGF